MSANASVEVLAGVGMVDEGSTAAAPKSDLVESASPNRGLTVHLGSGARVDRKHTSDKRAAICRQL